MSERVIRIAVRGLIVAIALIAAALAILAFQPGSETRFPDQDTIESAGSGYIALPVLSIAVPGSAAWRRPRPWLLWLWAAISVVASGIAFAFMDDVHPRYADAVFWPARAVELGWWVLAAVSTLGPLLAGFAARATQVTDHHEAPLLASRLRRFIG